MTNDEARREAFAKLEKAAASLVPDLIELVEAQEKKPMLTRGHYGAYMSVISTLAKGNRTVAVVTAMALKKAGANAQGVNDALRICCPM